MSTGQFQELIEHINSAIDAEGVLYKINYNVESIQQSGAFIKAFCPIHKETMIRSLIIDPGRRRFRCNYNNCPGSKGGTFFELYCLATGSSEEEAAKFWCKELGIDTDFHFSQAAPGAPPKIGKSAQGEDLAEVVNAEDAVEFVAAQPSDLIETESPVEADVAPDAEADLSSTAQASVAQALKRAEEAEAQAETVRREKERMEAALQEALERARKAEETARAAATTDNPSEPAREAAEIREEKPAGDYQQVFQSAVTAFESNKYSRAMETFQKALQQAGSSEEKAEAEIMLARCSIPQRKGNAALKLLQSAESRRPLSEVIRKEIVYRRAEAYESVDNLSGAIDALNALIRNFGHYRNSEDKIDRLRQRMTKKTDEKPKEKISFI